MPMNIPGGLSIAAVEQETGLSKDTLRVWERRYSFPQPGRDEFGERSYTQAEIEKLRLVKILLDKGYRPGKIISASVEQLQSLANPDSPSLNGEVESMPRSDLEQYVMLCKTHQVGELRQQLSQSLLRRGMYEFVTDIVAPLTTMIGSQWASGQLAVFEEHLYTESVQAVMRNAISIMPLSKQPFNSMVRPRILLTTVPNESHGLGLLMSEALLALEGAHCISLGVQTPVTEIARAAIGQQLDIVALSFSASMRSVQVLESLDNLHAQLPRSIEIWAGGRNAALQRRPPAYVKVLDLSELRDALADWRSHHSA